MDIPLAPVVVVWFKELRTLASDSAYVLPAHSRSRAARHGGDTHLNKDTLREAIDHWLRTEEPAVRRFTPHDLRSTERMATRNASDATRATRHPASTGPAPEWVCHPTPQELAGRRRPPPPHASAGQRGLEASPA